MSDNQLLVGLNNQQIEAVTHKSGPLLIVAGAGTGKTTVITKRVAWLIQQGLAKSDEILALTFTDKAALETEERVDKLLPLGYVDVWLMTFHAFAERVLKDYALEIGLPSDFKLLNQTEQWILVRNNLDKFNLDYYRPLGNPTRFIHALLQHFSRAKDEEIWPEQYLDLAQNRVLDSGSVEYLKKAKKTKIKKQKIKTVNEQNSGDEAEAARLLEVARAYQTYQQLLLAKGYLDFGDLINYTLKLFKRRPKVLEYFQKKFKYILVDEFQDTNHSQYELIKLLAAHQNITMVGDDDQSIYKFRGASLSNILEFKKDYPKSKEVFLNTNYRSRQNILDLAYKFIQLNNPYRLEAKLSNKTTKFSKKLKSVSLDKGHIEYLSFMTADDEAKGVVKKILDLKKQEQINWSDFAILVRANSSAGVFLRQLKASQLPFDYVASKGLYQEPIILEIISYLRLLGNYQDSESLYRVLTIQFFSLPPADLAILLSYTKKKTISLYQAVEVRQTLSLSSAAETICQNLLDVLAKHSSLAKQKSVAELYVNLVNDLGYNTRLAKIDSPEREATLLGTFYKRLQNFEEASSDKSLIGFLNYLSLEIEAGEEGELPADYEEGPDTVKVITVHSAKGLEWKYVFVVQLIDRRFPSTQRRESIALPVEFIKETLPDGDVHLQEERRLFYVALTRAKQGVFLTQAKDYFGKIVRKPSCFLYELGLIEPTKQVINKTLDKSLEVVNLAGLNKATYRLPKSHSFSSLSTFRKCPLEYKYKYLFNLPLPGSGAMSFGITIHNTLEKFLRFYRQSQGLQQGDLFSQGKVTPAALPTKQQLLDYYQQSWIDDWYDNKTDKEKYRNQRGPKQLDNFYQNFLKTKPHLKYLEKMFKVGMGPYKFTGKIDRLDRVDDGVVIIDYKTGGSAIKNLEKVDRDQLIIYQLAAESFLKEKVVGGQYWYLEPDKLTELFLASPKQLSSFKEEYVTLIDSVVATIKNDSFAQLDEKINHDCHYRKIGLS
ncbi:ATP-dependent helicase [Patescibacteria group bacterium]|nr:ATP-dependent helicase [Patescibacteria group bacterium]